MKTKFLAAVVLCLSASSVAQAALLDRGNGLLYDNVLKVTWLQDANYAKTSGYSATGEMDWNSANTWAANLNFDGLTGWRLATNTPINGSSFNTTVSYDGTTDYGYNITSPNSELSYMYYVNLGLKGVVDTSGIEHHTNGVFGNAEFGFFDNGTLIRQANVGLVKNLQDQGYWSGAETFPGSGYGWAFDPHYGIQYYYDKPIQNYAWAVHPGDVSAVPVPGAVWLFGSGLIALLGFKRRGNVE